MKGRLVFSEEQHSFSSNAINKKKERRSCVTGVHLCGSESPNLPPAQDTQKPETAGKQKQPVPHLPHCQTNSLHCKQMLTLSRLKVKPQRSNQQPATSNQQPATRSSWPAGCKSSRKSRISHRNPKIVSKKSKDIVVICLLPNAREKCSAQQLFSQEREGNPS